MQMFGEKYNKNTACKLFFSKQTEAYESSIRNICLPKIVKYGHLLAVLQKNQSLFFPHSLFSFAQLVTFLQWIQGSVLKKLPLTKGQAEFLAKA